MSEAITRNDLKNILRGIGIDTDKEAKWLLPIEEFSFTSTVANGWEYTGKSFTVPNNHVYLVRAMQGWATGRPLGIGLHNATSLNSSVNVPIFSSESTCMYNSATFMLSAGTYYLFTKRETSGGTNNYSVRGFDIDLTNLFNSNMVYDIGSVTVSNRAFSLTSTQVSDIVAMWNKGFCAVTITVDSKTYYAFKEGMITFNSNQYYGFVGTEAYVESNVVVKTGTVMVAISASNGNLFAISDNLDTDDVQTIVSGYTVSAFQNDAGYITLSDVPTELPAVTSSDNGKVLRVVSGAWSAVSLPSASGVNF